MENRERNEAIFEGLLKTALKEVSDQELEKIPTCEELDKMYKASPDYTKKLNKIISKSKRKNSFNTFRKYIKKVSVSAIFVVVILSALLLSVEASRNYIFNTVTQWYEKYISVQFGNSEKNIPNVNMPKPTYIPNGFMEVQSSLNGDIKFLIYQNSDNEKIIFEQYINASFATLVDNESKSFVSTDINGNEADFCESLDGDYNILFWKYNDSVLKLMSKIGIEDLIKIAKSIE